MCGYVEMSHRLCIVLPNDVMCIRKGKFLLEDNKINKPTKIVFIIYIILIIGLALFRAATGDTYKLQILLIEMCSVLLIMVSTIIACIIILIRDKISKHR